MPEELRSEVLLYVYREYLSLSAFESLPRDCRRRIALNVCHNKVINIFVFQIKLTFFNARDYLIRANDSPRNYFFLARGQLEVRHSDTDAVHTIGNKINIKLVCN